jgi:hypothetical protein
MKTTLSFIFMLTILVAIATIATADRTVLDVDFDYMENGEFLDPVIWGGPTDGTSAYVLDGEYVLVGTTLKYEGFPRGDNITFLVDFKTSDLSDSPFYMSLTSLSGPYKPFRVHYEPPGQGTGWEFDYASLPPTIDYYKSANIYGVRMNVWYTVNITYQNTTGHFRMYLKVHERGTGTEVVDTYFQCTRMGTSNILRLGTATTTTFDNLRYIQLGEPLNRPPSWAGLPGTFNAVEDVPYHLDLSPYIGDPDGDGIQVLTTSPYASVDTWHDISFTYPEGVTEEVTVLYLTDSELFVPREVRFRVQPVNDPPVVDISGYVFPGLEDIPIVVDMTRYVTDVDTPLDQL